MTKEEIMLLVEESGFEHKNHLKYRGRYNKCTVTEKFEIDCFERFAAAIKAAHIAELAGVEMPEPVYRALQSTRDGSFFKDAKPAWDTTPFDDPWLALGNSKVTDLITLDQLQTAVAAAVAKKDAELAEAQRLAVQRVAEVTRERDALAAEVERLTADAKRYRVVRSWNWTRSDGCPHIKVGLYDNGKFLGHYDYLEGDSLDAWVDKEMEQK